MRVIRNLSAGPPFLPKIPEVFLPWKVPEDSPESSLDHGRSAIANREGKVLAMSPANRGNDMVPADLPIGRSFGPP